MESDMIAVLSAYEEITSIWNRHWREQREAQKQYGFENDNYNIKAEQLRKRDKERFIAAFATLTRRMKDAYASWGDTTTEPTIKPT
jgi:hypothetical protein